MFPSNCELRRFEKELAVLDAKSVYDAMLNPGGGCKTSRSGAIEIAMARHSLQWRDSRIRWIPHGKVIVDALAKADLGKSNKAL